MGSKGFIEFVLSVCCGGVGRGRLRSTGMLEIVVLLRIVLVDDGLGGIGRTEPGMVVIVGVVGVVVVGVVVTAAAVAVAVEEYKLDSL